MQTKGSTQEDLNRDPPLRKNLTSQSQPLMRPESLMTLSKKERIVLIEGFHPVKIKKLIINRDL